MSRVEQGVTMKVWLVAAAGAVLTIAGAGPAAAAGSKAAKTPAPPPDWHMLMWFVYAGLVALIVVGGTVLFWVSGRHGPRRSLRMSLPGLTASWSFTDSWASNATVVTALFTAVFGSKDVTTLILGKQQTTQVLTVVMVAAAIAVGLAGLGPMVLQALRNETVEVTPLGLLFAGTLTLTATAGELAVVVLSLRHTPVGSWWVYGAGLAGAALLVWYAVVATLQNLRTGRPVKPKAHPKIAERRHFAGHPLQVHLEGLVDAQADKRVSDEDLLYTLSPTLAVPAVAEGRARPSALL